MSGLEYVYEDVAAFSLTHAQQLLASFRQHADGCPHDPGLNGSQVYNDIPIINGQATSWQIAPVTVTAAGAEIGAVEITKSDRGYDLIVIGKGRYLAFVRVLDCLCGIPPEPGRTLNRLIAAAAARMPAG